MTTPFDPSTLPDEAAPEPFVEQIKEVLEHLHDFVYLQRHPMAKDEEYSNETSGESPAQQLRRNILAAIETLSPGPGVAFRSPHARVYNMLHLRYVEGLTVHQAAHDLNLSLRQAHRDLRRGEESIAAMLWWRRHGAKQRPPAAPAPIAEEPEAPISELQAEMDRFELHLRPVDLQSLASRVVQSITPLAQQQGVSFDVQIADPSISSFTDPVVAQQVLISIASHAIQQASPGKFTLSVKLESGQPTLSMDYPIGDDIGAQSTQNLAAHLADRLGWVVEQTCHEPDRCFIHIQMSQDDPRHTPTLLVIDDNEGLKDLISRYLANNRCKIIGATSGQQGIEMAEESHPDVIILDVMMPEVDGWEVLQTLQHRAATQKIPVVICSVFNDPKLALSLGAQHLLPKPLRPEDLVQVLRELEVV